MGQVGFRVDGGYSRNQLSCRQSRKSDRARWRRVQRLSTLILSSSRVSSALRPSTSRRRNASARLGGSRDRQTPKTSQNSRVSRTELGSPRQESGMARQCPCASNAGSSTGRDKDSSDSRAFAVVLRRWSTIRCFRIPTSQVRSLDRPAKLSQPRRASRNVSCTSSAASSGTGREIRHSDRGNRRDNPPSFPVRFGVGKRRGRHFRLWSVRDVAFARKFGRSGPIILTQSHPESCSGDRTADLHFQFLRHDRTPSLLTGTTTASGRARTPRAAQASSLRHGREQVGELVPGGRGLGDRRLR